jgi:hypothetical protein
MQPSSAHDPWPTADVILGCIQHALQQLHPIVSHTGLALTGHSTEARMHHACEPAEIDVKRPHTSLWTAALHPLHLQYWLLFPSDAKCNRYTKSCNNCDIKQAIENSIVQAHSADRWPILDDSFNTPLQHTRKTLAEVALCCNPPS